MPTLSFDVLWRDRGAAKGLKELGTHAEKTKSSFDKANVSIGKGMGAAAGVVTKFGAAGALALGAAGAAAVGFGLKVASGNEQAKISFTTMLGSATKADKFLRNLQKFAASTPFEFPELQTAASSLISAGIEADKVIPIMTTLGDVTSGMGTGSEGVKRATIALQQMSAAGRITGEDLNQLRDAGIPVYDLLAAATGKSKEEVVKLAGAGKLGKKELGQMMKALEEGKGLERFSGLMAKQSKSLAGMFSTLKDTLGQGLADAITPAFPLIKDGLGTVSGALGDLFKWIGDNKDSFSNLFGTAGRLLKAFGGIAKGAIGPFITSLTHGQASFKDFADFISTHQGDIVGGFVALGGGAVKFGIVTAKVISAILRGFGGFSDGIGQVVAFTISRFADIAHGAAVAFGWIPGIGPQLKESDDKFKAFADHAKSNIHKTGDAARGLADGIDGKMVPALEAAGRGLDKVGKREIFKAEQRDAAKKAALAIDDIGTKANGAQLKLKTFADRTKLSADAQKGLHNRIKDARGALHDQLGAMRDAGVGQGKLTDAWKKGKEKLYDEFRQMGLSKREAKDLAAKYAGIKPKVKTEFNTPGLNGPNGARANTKDYDNKIEGLHGRSFGIKAKYSHSGSVKLSANSAGNIGGDRGGNAMGGVLPGWSPGRDIHTFTSASGGVLRLSGGEAVMRPEWTRAVGGPGAVAQMNADARAGRLQSFAGGGVIRATFSNNQPPNVTSHSNSAYNEAVHIALVSARKAAEKSAAAEVRRQKKALADAGGGPVGKGGYAHALSYARAHRGHPYWYGTLWDCSGFMSALHSIILGQSPHRRYSTTAFHGSHAAGFTRGKRSPFMVGVNPSPGKFGHMAGTLNGVNVESSGGVGVRVGGGARGHNAGMFSWRGGLANGGVIGDLPYDLLDPRGQRYNPDVAALYYATKRDEGGILRPGQAGVNRSGQDERVLSPRQTNAFDRMVRVMDRGGGGGGTTVIINAPNYVGSQEDLRRVLVDMDRRGQLTVLKRTR